MNDKEQILLNLLTNLITEINSVDPDNMIENYNNYLLKYGPSNQIYVDDEYDEIDQFDKPLSGDEMFVIQSFTKKIDNYIATIKNQDYKYEEINDLVLTKFNLLIRSLATCRMKSFSDYLKILKEKH